MDRESRIILYTYLDVALLLAALALVPPLSGHTGPAPFRVLRRDGLYQQYAHHLFPHPLVSVLQPRDSNDD